MNTQRLSYFLIALTLLSGIGLLGSAVAADRIISQKSAELSKIKAQSQVADELQQSLKKNKADIAKYAELNAIAKTVVPQDKGQAQTVGEIVKIAADSNIPNLSSITFPASTLGGAGATPSERSSDHPLLDAISSSCIGGHRAFVERRHMIDSFQSGRLLK